MAKSVTPSRIKENTKIIDLDADDLNELAAFAEEVKESTGFRRYVYPEFGVDFGFPDKL